MNFKKITSLLLAVLMVASALPLALFSAFADDANGSASAPVAGTAPDKLPNGEAYSTTNMFVDPKATIQKSTYEGANWISDTGRQVASVSHLNNAEGIMFKVDSSAIEEGTDALAFKLLFEIIVGETKDTWAHLSMNAGGTSWYGRNTPLEGTTSTWYYSADGATWAELTSAASNMPVTANREEAYVYVPFSEMWYDASLAEIKGDVVKYDKNDSASTGPSASYDEVKAAGYQNLTTGAKSEGTCRIRVNFDNNSMADAVLSDWTFVYKYEKPAETSSTAPTTLPNGETYKSTALYKSAFDLVGTIESKVNAAGGSYSGQTHWTAPATADAALAAVKDGAAGIMFKVDTTKATCISNDFTLTFALQIFFGQNYEYNTYLLSTARFAPNFSEGKFFDGASSTWYYAQDGKTWNEISNITSEHATVPAGKGYTYVFVPMDAFWTKCGETFLKTGKHAEYTEDGKVKATEPIVNWNDAVKLMGDDWTFGMANFYFAGKADKSSLEQDPATKISAWRLVTEGEPTAVGGSETPPPTLPDDETYVGTTVIAASFDMMATYRAYGDKKGDYSQTGWPGNVDAKMTEWIKDGAKGVMFKIDTTKATADDETFSMTFAIQVAFNGTSTYFVSTPKHATAFSEALMKDGASSTWYYSQNGTSWTSLEITASTGSYANIPAGKSYTYVYVPLDAFWTKCGETFLKTGDHAERTDDGKPKATEPIVNFSDAIAMMGDGWELKAFNFYFSGNSSKATLEQDVNTYLMDIKVVKYGVPGEIPEGGAEHAPEMLPNGEQYKAVPLDPDFSIKGNVYEGKAPDSNNTASSAWQSFWFASDKRLSDSEKIDFKTTGGEIQNAKGIMFKFDTSKAALANPTDILKMSVELSVNVPGGKSTYFLADPYYITSYGGKVVGTPSTVWYYSVDGFTWESVEKGKGGNGVGVTNACTVGYIYIPLDQFWTKGYKIDDVSKRATEALAEMGGEAKITDMKVRLGNDSVSSHANTVISDFMVIKSAYCMSRETVTIADTLEWNVYVAAPSTYSNAAMTFKMGDKTVDAKPQVLKDGSLKYTLTGISIADIATSVTAKWTATDDKGAPYSETYTTTMEKYMRAVLDNPANTDYVATVRALLHYAAALQTANGYKGDLANKDVPAVEASSVDLDRLQYTTYENNFTDMWGTPKLSVKDGVTTVKIPVTAPSKDYNKVRYETEYGRVGTVDIKNGYAYIPVYAHEMRLTFKLDFYKNGSMSNAGSMRFSLNYLLAQEYAANKADPAVVQAFANFCNEARKLKY